MTLKQKSHLKLLFQTAHRRERQYHRSALVLFRYFLASLKQSPQGVRAYHNEVWPPKLHCSVATLNHRVGTDRRMSFKNTSQSYWYYALAKVRAMLRHCRSASRGRKIVDEMEVLALLAMLQDRPSSLGEAHVLAVHELVLERELPTARCSLRTLTRRAGSLRGSATLARGLEAGGAWLLTAQLVTWPAKEPKRRAAKVSLRSRAAGEQLSTTSVLAVPPMESCRSRVSR